MIIDVSVYGKHDRDFDKKYKIDIVKIVSGKYFTQGFHRRKFLVSVVPQVKGLIFSTRSQYLNITFI